MKKILDNDIEALTVKSLKDEKKHKIIVNCDVQFIIYVNENEVKNYKDVNQALLEAYVKDGEPKPYKLLAIKGFYY